LPDLNRDVIYRDAPHSFTLNDSLITDTMTTGGSGTGLTGCVLDSIDTSDVDVVQFMEKRSMQDGMDAGDVFKGARRIHMSGVLYATTRPLLFDAKRALRAALDPKLAQLDVFEDKGFQPFYWSEPTADGRFNTDAIDFRVLAVPKMYQEQIVRDRLGGPDTDALSIQFRATLVCKDPTIYMAQPQEVDIDGTGTFARSIENRGTYPAPLNLLFSVAAGAGGTVMFDIAGVHNTIVVPTNTHTQIFRYKGADKILTVEETGGKAEAPRIDLLTFANATTHPSVMPGSNVLSMVGGGVTLLTDSRAWIWEAFS